MKQVRVIEMAKQVQIYADLLPDEYFLYAPQELESVDDYIDCPVCKQHALFNSGTLRLRGNEYDMFTCDDCGEVYYGEPLSSGAMKLRFYSDTEMLDPNKDVQDQFTQYLIKHKSVDAYKPQKSAFKDDIVGENKQMDLQESMGNSRYEVVDDPHSGAWIVRNTMTDEDIGIFSTEREAEEFAASLMSPEEEDDVHAFDEEVYSSDSLKDRVRAFVDLTGVLVQPSGIPEDGDYVVVSNISKKDLKDAINNYNTVFHDVLYANYDEIKDAYYIHFRP